MYLLYFYLPEEDLIRVKEALFAVGAGRIGHYERCCWQTQGEGQFCPKSGADPHLGTIDQLEHLSEYKVEMVFPDELLEIVKKTLKANHPYEEPAYGIIKLHG